MNKLVLTALLSLTLGGAWAGDYVDGHAALTPHDYALALNRAQEAAAKGNSAPQLHPRSVPANRQGEAPANAEAARWAKLGAAQGEPDAQYALAHMYVRGVDVAQDLVTAHMWFNLSAARGNTQAKRGRDLTTILLTPQQHAYAQKLALECVALKFRGCGQPSGLIVFAF